MNALSKAMMAEVLCHEVGLSKPDSKMMVELFFETQLSKSSNMLSELGSG